MYVCATCPALAAVDKQSSEQLCGCLLLVYVSHEALTASSTWEETRHGYIYVLHHDPSGLKHNKILTNQAECCWLSWCRMKGELTCSCAQGSADRWWRVALSLQSLTYAKLAGPANHITNNLQPNTKQKTTTLQDNRNLNVLPAYVCVCVCVWVHLWIEAFVALGSGKQSESQTEISTV